MYEKTTHTTFVVYIVEQHGGNVLLFAFSLKKKEVPVRCCAVCDG